MPWEETRARLRKFESERSSSAGGLVSDIRAALERIKELERLEVTDVAGWAARAEAAEAKLAKVVGIADHGIPYYAYGDNEAAVEMSHRLEQILVAAKEE